MLCPVSGGLLIGLLWAEGSYAMGDIPFVPEIYYEGTHYPICSHGFANNNEGAAEVCRALGYSNGGRVRTTNAVLTRDAMPVGQCGPGESVDSCSAGENAFGQLEDRDGRCKAGMPVGVEVICDWQV
jgi:hypothetical protein